MAVVSINQTPVISNVEDSSTALQVVINLSEALADPSSLQYRFVRDGSAQYEDWIGGGTGVTRTAVVPAGETSHVVSIVIPKIDLVDELDEYMTVEFFNPSTGLEFGTETPVLSIPVIALDSTNASDTDILIVSDPVIIEGDSGTRDAVFTVTLSEPAANAFDLDYETRDGSAEAGSDYTAVAGTLSFSTGEQSKTVTVPILSDGTSETAELFSLVVAPAVAAVTPNSMTQTVGEATILDDDIGSRPVISLHTDSGPEEEFSGTVTFAITLSSPSSQDVSVSWRLKGDTAEFGDVRLLTDDSFGTVTFAPGETYKTLRVAATLDDADAETDEAVTLELYNPTGAGRFEGRAPILSTTSALLDNDAVSDTPTIAVSNPVILEPDGGSRTASFDIRLSTPATENLTFDYATVDGSAVAGSDYVGRSGTITFVEGQQFANVRVAITGDTTAEGAEFFGLSLTQTGGASVTVRDDTGTARILDNDNGALPQLHLEVTQGATEGSVMQVTYTLSETTDQDVTFLLRPVFGTASAADLDSTFAQTVTIAAGEQSGTVDIAIAEDDTAEGDETLSIEAVNVENAVLEGGARAIQASGVILDNEGTATPLLSAGPLTFVQTQSDYQTTVEVVLSRPATEELTFDVTAADGTAVNVSDYALLTSQITFAAGQSTAAVQVEVKADAGAGDQTDEDFQINFAAATGTTYTGDISPVDVTIRPAEAIGSNTGEVLTGTLDDDLLFALGGDDTVYGRQGDDTLLGGEGEDVIHGGSGFDIASYNEAGSAIRIRLDNTDLNLGEAAGDRFVFIEGYAGSSFDDTLGGAEEADTFLGGLGEDYILGRGGNDTLWGDEGDDRLVGGDGDDLLVGGAGRDRFEGGEGTDTVSYESSDSGVNINLNLNRASRGDALGDKFDSIEVIRGSEFNDRIQGSSARDTIDGGDGADKLIGFFGSDSLYGGDGNDILRGEVGRDVLNGGDGFDWAWYATSSAAVTIDLANQEGRGGDAEGDTYISMEYGYGSAHDDTILGSDSGNILVGAGGADEIRAGGGNDRLRGGKGDGDELYGDAGRDRFDFNENDGADSIMDFEDDLDFIDLIGVSGLNTVGDALGFASQVGSDVVFDFGDGDELTVLNTTIAALNDDIQV